MYTDERLTCGFPASLSVIYRADSDRGRSTFWWPCVDQTSAHFLGEKCPSSSEDSIQLKRIPSVVSQVIGKGGGEHQVVKDCRIFDTKDLALSWLWT